MYVSCILEFGLRVLFRGRARLVVSSILLCTSIIIPDDLATLFDARLFFEPLQLRYQLPGRKYLAIDLVLVTEHAFPSHEVSSSSHLKLVAF